MAVGVGDVACRERNVRIPFSKRKLLLGRKSWSKGSGLNGKVCTYYISVSLPTSSCSFEGPCALRGSAIAAALLVVVFSAGLSEGRVLELELDGRDGGG